MKEHDLKVLPIHFRDVRAKLKKAEFRMNDRNFQAGDLIRLREWSPPPPDANLTNAADYSEARGYTGEFEERLISHVLTHEAFAHVPEGWVVVSMVELDGSDPRPDLTNVVPIKKLTTGDIPVDGVLRGALDAGLDSVVVAGWIKDKPEDEGPGELYVASSVRDDKTVFLLRKADFLLVRGPQE